MATIRAFLQVKGKLELKTGLHIGGNKESAMIGEKDAPIIREPLTNSPYIPGSSLKGKLRCLLEKALGKEPTPMKGKGEIRFHQCQEFSDYQNCAICNLFGIPAERFKDQTEGIYPTRLIFRDLYLTEESGKKLRDNPHLDLPMSQIKTEVVIDRFTSKANPRNIERLPAGVAFDLIIQGMIYQEKDAQFLKEFFKGFYLLEQDYLGGMGSRGYGRVSFKDLSISWETEGLANPLQCPWNQDELKHLTAQKLFDAFHNGNL